MGSEMMTAAILNQVSSPMRIERIPVPQPRAGEALVRVHACGVCHTDLHVIKGEVAFPTPAVLGHEISGTVEALGPGTDGPAKGTRIVAPFIMPCGTCTLCEAGRDDLCEKFFGMNRLKGTLYDGTTRLHRDDGSPVAMYSMAGLAEYSVVPVAGLFPLPDGLPSVESAVLGCAVFTAYGAVRHAAEPSGRGPRVERHQSHSATPAMDRRLRERRATGGLHGSARGRRPSGRSTLDPRDIHHQRGIHW